MTTCLAGAFVLAEEAAGAAGAAPAAARAPSLGEMLYSLAPIIAIFVLLMWFMTRSQKKRQKQRQQMLDSLHPKDDVVTIGGMHGRIISIKDDEVVLRVDPEKDVKVTFSRSGISHKVGEEGQAPE